MMKVTKYTLFLTWLISGITSCLLSSGLIIFYSLAYPDEQNGPVLFLLLSPVLFSILYYLIATRVVFPIYPDQKVESIALYIFGLILSLVFVFVGYMGLALASFSLTGECRNEILAESYSPDKKYKAVMFNRNCGATTGFNKQISILQPEEELPEEEELPDDGGNIFSSDHGEVEMEWKNNELLIIKYAPSTRIFENDEQMNDVKIHYIKTKN